MNPLTPSVIPNRDGRIVILTGAGISKESGLETFRDAGGIWSQVRLEDVATPEAFARDPQRCHAFYNMRRARHRNADIQPNAAHHALVKLEAVWLGEVLVVTQNVDTLHDRAGSKNLIHMHGTYTQARCNLCGDVITHEGDLSTDDICRACRKPGGMRPNVVWFGEMPMEMERIYTALSDCDLFLSIGTSGNVYPAAGFVAVVRKHTPAHTAELNLEPSSGATLFAEAHYGPATQTVPAYVDGLLRSL
jgi:NAD-dependent deacetylase